MDFNRSMTGPSSRAMIFAPLALLTLIFVLTQVAVLTDILGPTQTNYLMLAGIGTFLLTVFVIARLGLANATRLELLALRDTLTLLPNRRAIHIDFGKNAIPGQESAIALVDLDGFKVVNDHYGHGVGDKLIKQCAKIFSEICGPNVQCYRLSGDEFALLSMGPLSATTLESVCQNLIGRLHQTISLDDRRISIGASIGLASSNGGDGLSSSELLRRSDVAMSASKRGGKMRCTWFNEAFDQSRHAIREMENELRQALANEEFALAYQPLVDAQTRAVVAVECLLRWNRPDGNAIGPSVFIPIAEESGLINPIGLWVLEQACKDALNWETIKLSVNISTAQLRNPEFPVKLGQILEETGFPAERLELEITETCLVLDPIIAERSLNVIRGLGVKVALDDFGTGYASIGFLRQFRFEKLKLDRSLVVEAGKDEGSRAMMLSSITVARAMKMGVTAEGVETQAQADMVRAAGCDQIQGWFYFKAMPAEEVEQHLFLPAETETKRRANYRGVRP